MHQFKEMTSLSIRHGHRQRSVEATQERVIDRFPEAECHFLRFLASSRHSFPGIASIQTCPAGGWLLVGDQTLWLPRLPQARKLDPQGHILAEQEASLAGLVLDSQGLTVVLEPIPGYVTDVVVWHLTPPLRRELSALSSIERRSYFLWGSHTRYLKPADLYLHLIHGWVYENRKSWPKYWKICSENDAHALYTLFSGLERLTGKTLYRLFKQQLVLSVLDRQAEDGGFYHGEWSDAMESHFRLHTSAMHLLLDTQAETPDPAIANALEKGLRFVKDKADRWKSGIWFLHDSLEQSEAAMRNSPFQWLPSPAFGKSASNMLVLNTHWDTTVALERGSQLLGKPDWRKTLEAANQATLTVLSARSAEWLYRLVFGTIALSFLPAARQAALPLRQRALKRLGWQHLIPRFHAIKTRFPRLVMPGGYLDRALSLRGISTPYQAINAMDLVRLLRCFPELPLRPYLDRAIEFTYQSGLWERWAEEEKTRYAYGFWAEALYHLCLLDPDLEHRCRLAQTMLRLEQLNLGQPPSLLGANREAVDPVPPAVDLTALPSVSFADLSRQGKPEFLLLNAGEEPVSLTLKTLAPSLRWQDSLGQAIHPNTVTLPPKGWIIGQ